MLLDSSYVPNLFTINAQKLFHPASFSHIKAVEWMICIWSIQMLPFTWYKIIIHNIKNLRFIWNHCCMHDHFICDAATIRGMSFNNKNENFLHDNLHFVWLHELTNCYSFPFILIDEFLPLFIYLSYGRHIYRGLSSLDFFDVFVLLLLGVTEFRTFLDFFVGFLVAY